MKNNIQRQPLLYEKILSQVILYMLYIFIPIDMLNGFMLINGYPSISLAFKAFIVLLIFLFLFLRKKYLYTFFIFFVLACFTYINILIFYDIKVTIKNLDWMIKFTSITTYFMFFTQLIHNNESNKIFFYAKISFIFLTINFILGGFGFGYPMYSGDIGTKGYIFSGNEIGATIISTGAIVLMYNLEKKDYKNFFLFSMLMLGIAALLTSKVSILGTILIIFTFSLINIIREIENFQLSKKSFIFFNLVLVILPILFSGMVFYALYISNLIERLTYHYNKIDLLTLILSHRNIWAKEAWDTFLNHYTLIEYLFGNGKEWYIFITDNKLVEIDIIDFLMSYGIFGVLYVTSFLTYIFILLFKNRHKNPYFGYLLFTYFLMLGLSLTSGHIINSGIAGAIISALFALSVYQRKFNVFSNER